MLKCQDNFMLRIPSLPLEYLKKFQSQEKDIYNFIMGDKYLYKFFEKALIVSSQSVYQSFMHKPTDEKRYRDLNESLLKYFVRSIMRATPYGYMAGVSIGKFSDKTKLVCNDSIIDIQVDNAWLYAVIHNLESKYEIRSHLQYKFNTICYVSGLRLINPHYTNNGMVQESKEEIKEKNIRYTNLIRLIQKSAQDFLSYEELKNIISLNYPEVSNEIIESTIHTLIKSEVLISILRIPAYCDRPLEYTIYTLEKFAPNCQELTSLIEIQNLINSYKKDENIRDLEEICKKMEKFHGVSKNYISLNKGNSLTENLLSKEIKTKVENVMNLFYQMPMQVHSLQKFIEKFIEEYGTNIRVPLLEIIDKSGFNGTELLSIQEIKETEMERKLRKLINNKVFQAILNQKDEIEFVEQDFADVLDSDLQYPKDCDVNFIISYSNEKYQLFLAPCGGASNAGAMLQRFSKCFESNEFKRYNKIYQKINDIWQDENTLVEVREYSVYGRTANILNSNQNIKNYITFGNTTINGENELYLKDISVELTQDNQLFLYSEVLQKRIKVVENNMLNPQIQNEVVKLLLMISEQGEYFPERRLMNFVNHLEYKYVPRIKVEGVVISTKRWILDECDLSCNDFCEFSLKFRECKQKYKIDSICYNVDGDNRILLNLDSENSLHILYKEYKRRKILYFKELETEIGKLSMIEDQNNFHYMGEFVFSLITDNVTNVRTDLMNSRSYKLDSIKRKNILFEEGWIYFKLYGIGDKDNEIISQYLPELINDLDKVEHFFIRYSDLAGKHLRIRIKFHSPQLASKNMLNITNWANKLIDTRVLSNIVFDTYIRENNRYGGNLLIDAFEKVFFEDSLLVEKTLLQSDLTEIENIEKRYIYDITYFLMQLSEGTEDMLQKIDTLFFENKYRKTYREDSKKYISWVQNVLDHKFDFFNNIESEIKQMGTALISYKKQLYDLEDRNLLTNDLNSIVFSVIHMHCNRLTGNRLYEDKYLELVRNALYHIVRSIKAKKR